jgi:hypothetical protein
MDCPYCEKPLEFVNGDTPLHYLETYGGMAKARTKCCGKIVAVYRVLSFEAETSEQTAEDDWGH